MKSHFLAFLLFTFAIASSQVATAKPPNIVILLADDLGYSDLGCYGSEISTPNIDQLAKDGLRFTQFYNNAKCAPSRTSLLTGVYPQQPKNGLSIAQVLKSAGYRTLMTGRNGGLAGPPWKQGFDRFFGLYDGCCNYFNPGLRRSGESEPGRKYPFEQRAWAIDGKVIRPYTPKSKDFYSTDAFTDCAIEYLDRYGKEDKPFFLYVPFTAPHFPLHARPQEIAKYRGKYKIGWDVVRRQRHKRLIDLGIIDKKWKLSPRDPNVPPWTEIDDPDRWDLQMAVYAAMIDRMDQGIGRILAKLRQLGVEDNTLVLFLSDNGACAEDYRAFRTTAADKPPGPLESYRTQDVPWANASNTPFRKYKWWVHEGGIATPLIAYWPRVIEQGGQVTHQVGHIMDIMATCLDVADYPTSKNGKKTVPLEGKSLLPIFQGEQREGHSTLYWQFGRCRAVRKGKWKLVAAHPNPRLGIDFFSEGGGPAKKTRWELYDMQSDRTESNDLADSQREKVRELAKLHEAWIARTRATD